MQQAVNPGHANVIDPHYMIAIQLRRDCRFLCHRQIARPCGDKCNLSLFLCLLRIHDTDPADFPVIQFQFAADLLCLLF